MSYLQEIFVYIYNILFIILYLWVINVAGYAYKATGNNFFYYAVLLYVILIIDSTTAFSFDILKMSNSWLQINNRVYCLIRILIYLIGGCCYVKLMSSMLLQKPRFFFYLPIIGVTLVDIVAVLGFYNNFDTSILQRSVQDTGILFLCLIYAIYSKKLNRDIHYKQNYDKAVGLTAVLMILSVIEGVVFFIIHGLDIPAFSELLSYMKIIGFNEDLFSIIISLLIIWFAKKEEEIANKNQLENLVQQKMNQYQAMIHEKENANEENQVIDFCKYYKMTKRESEILRLVLKGKKNQEIADELFISVGTVKSHIYSIYKKLEVDRRSQLMHIFMEYQGK